MIAPPVVSISHDLPSARSNSDADVDSRNTAPFSRTTLFIAAAFLLAAVFTSSAHLALTWDGSYFLLKALETHSVAVSNHRFGIVLFHIPALCALRLWGSTQPVMAAFCMAYALVPFTSVCLAWLSVRRSAPHLLLWPLIAIGLLSIPAQPCVLSENMIACQLAWALFLGMLCPGQKAKTACLILLAVSIASLHPVSILLLLLTASAPVILKCLGRTPQRNQILLAVACFVLAIARAALLILSSSPYEHDKLSRQQLIDAILQGYSELPLQVFVSGVSAALCLTLAPLFTRLKLRTVRFNVSKIIAVALIALAVLSCTAGGAAAIWWSASLNKWYLTWGYGRFLGFSFALLMLLALWDSVRGGAKQEKSQSPGLVFGKTRLAISCVLSIIFVIAAATQSHIWGSLTDRYRAAIYSSKKEVICLEREEWLRETPINHWSATSLSILLQERTPKTLVLQEKEIADAGGRAPYKLAPFEPARLNKWITLPTSDSNRVRIEHPLR